MKTIIAALGFSFLLSTSLTAQIKSTDAEKSVASEVATEEKIEALSIENPQYDLDRRRLEDQLIKSIEDRYAARLDALSMERKSFDNLVTAVWYFGGIILAFVVALSYFGGKSLLELRRIASDEAKEAIEDAVRSGSNSKESLTGLIDVARESIEQIETIKGKLAGYVQLSDVAASASGFDPFSQYQSLRSEIQKRKSKTREMMQGNDKIGIEETTHDPIFRQRAAVVFEELLAAAEKEALSYERKFTDVDLFNAAANAAEMDLEFVALQLMEIAGNTKQDVPPEIEARLIRQRLSFGRVSNAEARNQIAFVLSRVGGFDLHHVVSEAFNIAMRVADPEGLVHLISTKLQTQLQDVSYVHFTNARLLAMGSTKMAWKKIDHLVNAGLLAMQKESREARWFESSQTEFGRLIDELPDNFPVWENNAVKTFGIHDDIPSFAKRNGLSLTQSLLRAGLIDFFIK